MILELRGKKVLVVGLGVSGRAAALLCLAQGAVVRATDLNPIPPVADELAAAGVRLSLGGHQEPDFSWAELIVLSPGVDHRLPEVEQARAAGTEVIGELELGWRFTKCPTVMITGTNGKSTVTTLVGDILNQAGFKTLVGGNLGRPVCDMALESGEADWLVAEVSSFQTDTMDKLRPRVGVVLNITPDHQDRYPDFAAYAHSKMRLLANQAGDDVAVLCADEPEVWSRRDAAPAQVWGYGADGPKRPGGWLEGGELVLDAGGKSLRLPLPSGHLAIGFNRLNCLAACLAALACGAEAPAMRAALESFQALGHRLALVGEKGGVSFYDDSKGTNVGAVAAALGALEQPVVLLLGGRDKDGRFADLGPLLAERAARVICFGEAGPKIQAQIKDFALSHTAPDLAAAVHEAAQTAAPGQAVLLSPGCASFDAYSGYAQRGEHFHELVREVMHG
ncbi:MAG: UDP-N-acetylmuramoyl-L-alanine--D-glutamate ligase [Deltaproteobacteria bacterium]|nr:UDP-N-acetylmuramoyl-L-alanine--D-glutamate ligase [Deltaproteobacteria bacterium]